CDLSILQVVSLFSFLHQEESQDHPERRSDSSYLRLDERALLAQVTPLEDSIKQKTELAHGLRPESLEKWYRSSTKGTEKTDQMCCLQPVRNILPDIGRTDDLIRRQAALESWLSDAHHIRCLLLRYVNWPQEPTTEQSVNIPMEQRRNLVSARSSDCSPCVKNKGCEIGIKDLEILSQSCECFYDCMLLFQGNLHIIIGKLSVYVGTKFQGLC
ncbi:hypothetical protein PHET_09605, partial [Paragonimus heterotremus]